MENSMDWRNDFRQGFDRPRCEQLVPQSLGYEDVKNSLQSKISCLSGPENHRRSKLDHKYSLVIARHSALFCCYGLVWSIMFPAKQNISSLIDIIISGVRDVSI
jgi:hypothetical protein